jgi:hypothetical protein
MLCDLAAGFDRNSPQQQYVALKAYLRRHRVFRNMAELFDLEALVFGGGCNLGEPLPTGQAESEADCRAEERDAFGPASHVLDQIPSPSGGVGSVHERA